MLSYLIFSPLGVLEYGHSYLFPLVFSTRIYRISFSKPNYLSPHRQVQYLVVYFVQRYFCIHWKSSFVNFMRKIVLYWCISTELSCNISHILLYLNVGILTELLNFHIFLGFYSFNFHSITHSYRLLRVKYPECHSLRPYFQDDSLLRRLSISNTC